MATSEEDIRNGVAILLSKYGSLTTDQVKKYLETVIPFDDDDRKRSKTRPNEILIMQRIGNIVSHQKNNFKIYKNVYSINKTDTPATWSILTGIGNKRVPCKVKKQVFKPQKIKWDEVQSYRTDIGRKGEDYAVRFETKQVLNFSPYDTDSILHLSKEQGDGAGFDILSIDKNGNSKYIEVKTTKRSKDTPFFMSKNEKNFFKSHQNSNDAFIYRIYNFDSATKTGKVLIISAIELFKKYTFNPTSYLVTKK